MTEFVIFVVVMIVLSLISKAKQQSTSKGKPNPRVQALIERIQAQQGGNQPIQIQGQFTQAAGRGSQGGPPPAPTQGRPTFPAPQQPAMPSVPTPQYQPVQYNQNPYQPPAHRPQRSALPTTNQDLDARIRELMKAGNEVGAIRLLSDEREMGILDAQKYARSLVTPQSAPPAVQQSAAVPTQPDELDEDDGRYVGSAAFAESIFNLDDRDENVWASGWVDKPEPEDRTDIDELWQTVSNPPRPGTTPPR